MVISCTPTGRLAGCAWAESRSRGTGAVDAITSARRGRDTPRMPPIAPVTLAALRRAHDLIDREYAESLDLDALAREAGYSKYHFARSFAAAYGETPRAYLTRRRVERAKNLLRTANLSVTEICFVVGFSSLGSFSSLFRRLVGQSPTGYREASLARGTAPPIPGCMILMWTRPTDPSPQG
jgi:AraC-like DNA-binding protein